MVAFSKLINDTAANDNLIAIFFQFLENSWKFTGTLVRKIGDSTGEIFAGLPDSGAVALSPDNSGMVGEFQSVTDGISK